MDLFYLEDKILALKDAINKQKQVVGVYDQKHRTLYPHLLGLKKKDFRCLFYELEAQDWRCLKVKDLEILSINDITQAEWKTLPSWQDSNCVDNDSIVARIDGFTNFYINF